MNIYLSNYMRRRIRNRRRGFSLMEVMLSIIIIGLIIVAMAENTRRESKMQQDKMMANRSEIIANAAKGYVGEQYDSIREQISGAATTSDPGLLATMTLTIQDLVSRGYLSEGFASGTQAAYFDQEYRLFIRPVLRSDTNWPQQTMTNAEITSLNTNDPDGKPVLTNGVYEMGIDDEMDLEAVIISESDDDAVMVSDIDLRAARVTTYSGNPTMAVIKQDPVSGDMIASGNLGAFTMPMAPWSDIGANVKEGHFLSLISMSGTGLDGAGGGNGSADLRGALRRCEDLMDPDERDICLKDGNIMYSNIVFNTISTDTPYEQYPGIQGLKKISCVRPDSPNLPTGDINSETDEIFIDCGNVNITDNLTVQEGDVAVQQGDVLVQQGDVSIENGTLTINGNEISNNLIMAQGQGLNGQVLPANPITDEMCPKREDGTSRQFKVETWITGLIEPVGRPLSGYRISYRGTGNPRGMSLAENPSPTTGQFVADVIGFVNEDHCTNVAGGGTILSPNNIDGLMTLADFQTIDGSNVYDECLSGGTTQPDSYPDAYFLNDNQATINYAVYCQ